MKKYILLPISLILLVSCEQAEKTNPESENIKNIDTYRLSLDEANRLFDLPLKCIQQEFPYKSGLTIAKEEDLQLPKVHHPAFYGCFDWHSAVHGHWSIVYLIKQFPEISNKELAIKMIDENLQKENITQEVAYFSLNKSSKSFERTYGWAWLLKLQEELYTWDNPNAKKWYDNIKPLADHISSEYITYLPKLVYPIRVGEHSNTAFGLSFAYDYAITVGDKPLANAIEKAAKRFYQKDQKCPIGWEPSGYDFLSPCLQELDIMSKVLSAEEFDSWSKDFLPQLYNGSLNLEPAIIKDRSDGKLVHLDGLNFSRAWCLYAIQNNKLATTTANEHLSFSLKNIVDGDYAGQHWLASFALYAFKAQNQLKVD